MHVIISKLRRKSERYCVMRVENVIDNIKCADASVSQDEIFLLDIYFILPVFSDRFIKCLAVWIRSES